MKTSHRVLRAIALAALLALGPSAEAADDTALFANQVPPNVMLIVDNSLSMNNVVTHPAYNVNLYNDGVCSTDPSNVNYNANCTAYPLCPIVYGDAEFDVGSTNNWDTRDGGVVATRNGLTVNKSDNNADCGDREVYADPIVQSDARDTWWKLHYLRWYFSANVNLDHDGDGRSILTEILDTNDGVKSACLGGGTYALYRRSRVSAARSVLREVICNTSLSASIRFGLAKFKTWVSSEADGGYVAVPIANYTSAQESALDRGIANVDGETSTPLGETLY